MKDDAVKSRLMFRSKIRRDIKKLKKSPQRREFSSTLKAFINGFLTRFVLAVNCSSLYDGVVQNMEYTEGTIEQVIFYSPDTGYTVCKFVLDDGQSWTIVGSFPPLSPGEEAPA